MAPHPILPLRGEGGGRYALCFRLIAFLEFQFE